MADAIRSIYGLNQFSRILFIMRLWRLASSRSWAEVACYLFSLPSNPIKSISRFQIPEEGSQGTLAGGMKKELIRVTNPGVITLRRPLTCYSQSTVELACVVTSKFHTAPSVSAVFPDYNSGLDNFNHVALD
jgi:hypothetical protein